MAITLRGNKGAALSHAELDANFTDFMDLSASGASRTLLGIRAPYKSFLIDHPTKPGMKLQYGSLEGPEHGVYVRGRLTNERIITLPEYWLGLVNADTITVQLTPVGKHQNLYVDKIENNQIFIDNSSLFGGNVDCFYIVHAERKDVPKLEIEIYK